MHTTQLPSGREAHHNGDMSGNVRFDVPLRDTGSYADATGEIMIVEIPFGDLKYLVAGWLQGQAISRLEQAETDDLFALAGGLL